MIVKSSIHTNKKSKKKKFTFKNSNFGYLILKIFNFWLIYKNSNFKSCLILKH